MNMLRALLRRARNNRLTQILFILMAGATLSTFFIVTIIQRSLLLSTSFEEDVSAHETPLYPSGNSSLIDLTNFRYIINNQICLPHEDVFLLILIHSAPRHFQNRDTIRKTWGHESQVDGHFFKTVFLLARVEDSKLQEALSVESEQHGDIVQGNFIDAYRNLTYKHIMGLRWAGQSCQQAEFVLKMDDDIFVEIFHLVRLLESRYPRSNAGPRLDTIGCYVQNNMPVVRDEGSKWFVSKSEYSKNTFDNYCSGWAYVTSPQVARQLAESARFYRYFWVDDVHVTGILAKHARLRLDRLNWCFTIETRGLVEWALNVDGKKLSWQHIFGPTWGDMELMVQSHRKAIWCRRHKCKCCFKPRQMEKISSTAFVALSGSAYRIAI